MSGSFWQGRVGNARAVAGQWKDLRVSAGQRRAAQGRPGQGRVGQNRVVAGQEGETLKVVWGVVWDRATKCLWGRAGQGAEGRCGAGQVRVGVRGPGRGRAGQGRAATG